MNLYDYKLKKIDGSNLDLKSLKGNPLLIANIATQCGFTYQLGDLEKLYQKYKDRKLMVLGVPSNDFGGQTPEDEKTVANFCEQKFGVSFPLTEKTKVVGKDKSDIFKFLTGQGGEISWNFEKFLVDSNGNLIKRWKSSIGPLDKEITREIEKLLGK